MDITGLVAVLGAFGIGPAIVYLRNRHKLEERKLELEARNGRGGGQETRQLIEDNKLLRERVENLESIVCSVDFELNQKLSKVLDEQRSLMLPGGTAGAAGAGGNNNPTPPEARAPDGASARAPVSRAPGSPAVALDRTATAHAAT